jgi:Zn-dependent protease with chaperone function
MPDQSWREIYGTVMSNSRNMETRCDRLGLLLCGDWKSGASALLTVALKSVRLARAVDPDRYLSVQYPLLATAPALGPITVNAGHPFVPFRVRSLLDFVNSGRYEFFQRLFGR